MATQASDSSSKYRLRTSASDELAVIAQRAQAFTNASGAAVALSEGNADEIVCRARSGSSAPDVGVSLRVEGSFTGICIQTGKELRCDDTETDTRVDGAAMRTIGIRSMVITPVKEDSRVIGVLAVFAPTPHAFTITHVAVLKTMADQISALLLRERRAREEGLPVEPVVTAPKPPVAVSSPPPVVIKPSNSHSSSAAAVAPARVNTSPAPKVESKVEPIRAAAPDLPAPVPFPKREERREERRFEPKPEPPKPSFGTLDTVAGEPKRAGGNKSMMMIGAAVVLVAVAGGSWFLLKKGKSTPPQTTAVAAASPTTAQPPAPTTTAGGTTATNPPVNSLPATTTQPPATAPAPSKPAADTRTENRRPERVEPQPRNETKPAPTPETTVALSSGPSRISAASEQPQTSAPAVAPSLSVASGSSNSISSLTTPANNSKVAMIAQSELVNAEVISRSAAVYPAIAKARRLTGTVTIKVKVGKDGNVSNPQFVSGPIVFKDAAFDSVKQWKYKPATLNGQPIEQEQEIKITFRP